MMLFHGISMNLFVSLTAVQNSAVKYLKGRKESKLG